jgi:hypothetical protein
MESPVPVEPSDSKKKSRAHKYLLVILIVSLITVMFFLPVVSPPGSSARAAPLEQIEAVVLKISDSGNQYVVDVTNTGSATRDFSILVRFTDGDGKRVAGGSILISGLKPGQTGEGKFSYPSGASAGSIESVGIIDGNQRYLVDYTLEGA